MDTKYCISEPDRGGKMCKSWSQWDQRYTDQFITVPFALEEERPCKLNQIGTY